MFNPFSHQYSATYLRSENDYVVARVQGGQLDREIALPPQMLPKELPVGSQFMLTVQPIENRKNTEYDTLKRLLEELIR